VLIAPSVFSNVYLLNHTRSKSF